MARIHRKLFPAISTTNQSQECSDYCDPACPYNCYSFPDYYFPPPPPPPPADHSALGNQISSYLVILASLFTIIFVLVAFYVIKVKCYADWCGRRHNGSPTSQSHTSDEEFLHENQVDHPIWLITTIGLQQSIINSITVCKYRKGEGLIEGTECSVCLNEFQENETLRLLPKCNHAFHIPCIDTWLRSHINCPLCRAVIISNNVSSEAAMSNLASMEDNTNDVGINQDTQMEQNDDELVNNMLVIASRVSENRDGTEETGEAQEFIDESISKERGNVDGNHVVQILNDPTENHQVLNDEIETEMRSVSMDYRLGGSSLRVDDIKDDTEPHTVNLVKRDGDYSTLFKTVRRSSIAPCLHVSPVLMKRSNSCSGRTVSTRGHRTLNSSLPYYNFRSIEDVHSLP